MKIVNAVKKSINTGLDQYWVQRLEFDSDLQWAMVANMIEGKQGDQLRDKLRMEICGIDKSFQRI